MKYQLIFDLFFFILSADEVEMNMFKLTEQRELPKCPIQQIDKIQLNQRLCPLHSFHLIHRCVANPPCASESESERERERELVKKE